MGTVKVRADQPPYHLLTAAEVMLGELPAGVEPRNFGDTAGPAYSQLFFAELVDERENEDCLMHTPSCVRDAQGHWVPRTPK